MSVKDALELMLAFGSLLIQFVGLVLQVVAMHDDKKHDDNKK